MERKISSFLISLHRSRLKVSQTSMVSLDRKNTLHWPKTRKISLASFCRCSSVFTYSSFQVCTFQTYQGRLHSKCYQRFTIFQPEAFYGPLYCNIPLQYLCICLFTKPCFHKSRLSSFSRTHLHREVACNCSATQHHLIEKRKILFS